MSPISRDGSTYVDPSPNSAPPMVEVWVFVSRDEKGQENVLGQIMGALGTQPLMTGNPRLLPIFTDLAKKARDTMKGQPQTIHLLKFSNREEVEF